MKYKTFRYFIGDFETTVYKGQKYTEVWASACVELNTEDVQIFHSIEDTYKYLKSFPENVCIYYHNLKFDGSFWLDFLLKNDALKQAYESDGTEWGGEFIDDSKMKNNTYKYSISAMGQWYTITIKVNDKFIEIRDSLKLLPFSVKRIGNSFGTKHKKLDMEYVGYRYAGCEISEEEQKYIANDVLVVKEAMEIMFNEGHNKLTIGSCCLSEFRKDFTNKYYDYLFPDLYEISIDSNKYGCDNAGAYIRKSYRGGWCYLVKGKENQIKTNGTTADVNSLYPSMMSSESGNYYPIGKPNFWKGNTIPTVAKCTGKYFFIRIKTRFYLKEGKLPFIQIKGTGLYKGTESLTTSDIYDSKTNEYYKYYYDFDGVLQPATPILTLTCTDYKLFLEHYDVEDFEILDGCWFDTIKGIFDMYMDTYKNIKMNSKGAKRELAKLFLNNLYGKMAANTDSSFKYAYVKEDNSIGFLPVTENKKRGGYIPVGSAITSYARCFTIRAAQQNYYGVDKRGFIYADTDSIHCDLKPNELRGITADPVKFCCWKLESCWDKAIFTRQKTYIEHITHENLEEIDTPFYDVKCAGMPNRCKDIFVHALEGTTPEEMSETEKEFFNKNHKLELTDFNLGLKLPSKLMPKRIQGGVVLKETTYEMR